MTINRVSWVSAVCARPAQPRVFSGESRALLIWLSFRLDDDLELRVSRDVIASAFDVSTRSIDKRLSEAVNVGLLHRRVAGRKGVLPVYRATIPSANHQPVVHGDRLDDAGKQALARYSAKDGVRAETTYRTKDGVRAETALSAKDGVRTSSRQNEGESVDSPWSEQEPAGDEGADLSWIDEVVRGQDPDEVGLSQGAKRPASPEAQRKVSDAVKKALEDWGVGTPGEANSNRSGGRAA